MLLLRPFMLLLLHTMAGPHAAAAPIHVAAASHFVWSHAATHGVCQEGACSHTGTLSEHKLGFATTGTGTVLLVRYIECRCHALLYEAGHLVFMDRGGAHQLNESVAVERRHAVDLPPKVWISPSKSDRSTGRTSIIERPLITSTSVKTAQFIQRATNGVRQPRLQKLTLPFKVCRTTTHPLTHPPTHFHEHIYLYSTSHTSG